MAVVNMQRERRDTLLLTVSLLVMLISVALRVNADVKVRRRSSTTSRGWDESPRGSRGFFQRSGGTLAEVVSDQEAHSHRTTLPVGLDATKEHYGLKHTLTDILTFTVEMHLHAYAKDMKDREVAVDNSPRATPSNRGMIPVGTFSVGVFGNEAPSSDIVAAFKAQCLQLGDDDVAGNQQRGQRQQQQSALNVERIVHDLLLFFSSGEGSSNSGDDQSSIPPRAEKEEEDGATSTTGVEHRIGSVGVVSGHSSSSSFYVLLDPLAAQVLNAQQGKGSSSSSPFGQVLEGWTTTVARINKAKTDTKSKPENFDFVVTACTVDSYPGPSTIPTDSVVVAEPDSPLGTRPSHHSRGSYLRKRNEAMYSDEVSEHLKEHGLLP